MAKIVLGIGSSHSPMLSTPPELFPEHGSRDRANPQLLGPDARYHSYDELLRTANPKLAGELTPEKHRARHEAIQRAIDTLEKTLAAAAPDVVVVVGDDQKELFHDDNMPALAVYTGDSMLNSPRPWSESSNPVLRASAWGYGEEEREYPVHAGLACHIVQSLIKQDFDVTQVGLLREGQSMPHAFAFVVRRIVNARIVPMVPVFLNTFYPPNSPTVRRCYAVGKALAKAIEQWPSDARVAVVASGGLSHFVLNESWDHELLDALKQRGPDKVCRLPEERFQSGDSEGKNWIATAAAAEHLTMELVDYVPTPRTPAGTGGGWAFARWQ